MDRFPSQSISYPTSEVDRTENKIMHTLSSPNIGLFCITSCAFVQVLVYFIVKRSFSYSIYSVTGYDPVY